VAVTPGAGASDGGLSTEVRAEAFTGLVIGRPFENFRNDRRPLHRGACA
jgi:hypothetical protein